MQKAGVGNKVFHYVYSSMYFLFQDKSYKRTKFVSVFIIYSRQIYVFKKTTEVDLEKNINNFTINVSTY